MPLIFIYKTIIETCKVFLKFVENNCKSNSFRINKTNLNSN